MWGLMGNCWFRWKPFGYRVSSNAKTGRLIVVFWKLFLRCVAEVVLSWIWVLSVSYFLHVRKVACTMLVNLQKS